jgi:hypothetical protein
LGDILGDFSQAHLATLHGPIILLHIHSSDIDKDRSVLLKSDFH